MSTEPLIKDIEDQVNRERRTISMQSEEDKMRSRTMSNAGRARTVSEAIRNAEKYKVMTEHKMELSKLYRLKDVDPNQGLSDAEALKRNKKHGDNVLTGKKKTPWYILLAKEMIASFSLLLWIGAILCFIVYGLDTSQSSNLYLGLALVFVIVFSGIQNYLQNAKSDAIMEAFKNFIPPKAKVLRNGSWQSSDAIKLVPGDIVEIKAGDRIPADLRIIFSQEMKVDNSSLTGESDPLLRKVECTAPENPLETANLAFFGTLCPEGLGRGIVINIGNNTIIGQIAGLASAAEAVETPLRREMNRFVKIIAVIAFGTGIGFFIIGFLLGYDILTDLISGIGILCAYVPEGLVTCVVVALTITATRLATKKVLVKNLESVETLGSASCICSDKTGTLTQNRMTVENVWYDGQVHRALNYQKHQKTGEKLDYDLHSEGFKAFQECATLCSDATFDNAVPPAKSARLDRITDEAEKERMRKIIEEEYRKELEGKMWLDRPVIGDASETALVKFLQAIEDVEHRRKQNPIRTMADQSIARIPFNSAWKYALVICENRTGDSDNCIYIKGAPERIWGLSNFVWYNGKPVPKDEAWEKKFDEANKFFGNGGQRVLGFAKMHLNRQQYPADYQFDCKNAFQPNYPMQGFAFCGLVSLVDPPREAVPFAILKCKTAGIKVIMVTGDQPATAAAIARQVNIFEKREMTVDQVAEERGISKEDAFDLADALVVHGDELTKAAKEDETLPPEQRGKRLLKWLSKPRIVFARTTPAQKLIIVKACQSQGHVVAVTGDGVNDSPAIKKADIGIAMGITGSDVAKDAADMVLLTDDFAAIVLGIEEGRKIYDNLKRAIIYCLAANIAELFPFLGYFILQVPLPLSSILILCIDLGFNIFPAISFASEEAELDIMVRPPRTKNDHLVTGRLITSAYLLNGVFESFGGYLVYYVVMNDFGFSPSALNNLASQQMIGPNAGDVFDPNAAYNGITNTNFINYCNSCWQGGTCDIQSLSGLWSPLPDWFFNNNATMDLRLYYQQCGQTIVNGQTVNTISSVVSFPENCNVHQLSDISFQPVCFTPDSLKYAQTGFYVSVALSQIFLIFVLKTRRQSFYTSGLSNYSMIFGLASIALVILMICYFRPLNEGFNSRGVIFLHFGFPAIPFGLFMFCFDEAKKFMVRNGKAPSDKPTNWYDRNTVW